MGYAYIHSIPIYGVYIPPYLTRLANNTYPRDTPLPHTYTPTPYVPPIPLPPCVSLLPRCPPTPGTPPIPGTPPTSPTPRTSSSPPVTGTPCVAGTSSFPSVTFVAFASASSSDTRVPSASGTSTRAGKHLNSIFFTRARARGRGYPGPGPPLRGRPRGFEGPRRPPSHGAPEGSQPPVPL